MGKKTDCFWVPQSFVISVEDPARLSKATLRLWEMGRKEKRGGNEGV